MLSPDTDPRCEEATAAFHFLWTPAQLGTVEFTSDTYLDPRWLSGRS